MALSQAHTEDQQSTWLRFCMSDRHIDQKKTNTKASFLLCPIRIREEDIRKIVVVTQDASDCDAFRRVNHASRNCQRPSEWPEKKKKNEIQKNR